MGRTTGNPIHLGGPDMPASWLLQVDPDDTDDETPPADYPEDDHAGNQ